MEDRTCKTFKLAFFVAPVLGNSFFCSAHEAVHYVNEMAAGSHKLQFQLLWVEKLKRKQITFFLLFFDSIISCQLRCGVHAKKTNFLSSYTNY